MNPDPRECKELSYMQPARNTDRARRVTGVGAAFVIKAVW